MTTPDDIIVTILTLEATALYDRPMEPSYYGHEALWIGDVSLHEEGIDG